jgi:hypothetical protein
MLSVAELAAALGASRRESARCVSNAPHEIVNLQSGNAAKNFDGRCCRVHPPKLQLGVSQMSIDVETWIGRFF